MFAISQRLRDYRMSSNTQLITSAQIEPKNLPQIWSVSNTDISIECVCEGNNTAQTVQVHTLNYSRSAKNNSTFKDQGTKIWGLIGEETGVMGFRICCDQLNFLIGGNSIVYWSPFPNSDPTWEPCLSPVISWYLFFLRSKDVKCCSKKKTCCISFSICFLDLIFHSIVNL